MKNSKNTSKKALHPGIGAARQVLHPLRGGAAKNKRNKKAAPRCTSGARITFILEAKKAHHPRPPRKSASMERFSASSAKCSTCSIPIKNNKYIHIHIYIGGYIRKGVDHRGAKKRGGMR